MPLSRIFNPVHRGETIIALSLLSITTCLQFGKRFHEQYVVLVLLQAILHCNNDTLNVVQIWWEVLDSAEERLQNKNAKRFRLVNNQRRALEVSLSRARSYLVVVHEEVSQDQLIHCITERGLLEWNISRNSLSTKIKCIVSNA